MQQRSDPFLLCWSTQGDHPTPGRGQAIAPTMPRSALPGSSRVGDILRGRPIASTSAAKEPGLGDEVRGRRLLLSSMDGTRDGKGQFCHAEHIRCSQCKLREAPRGPARQILRFAQDDTLEEQHERRLGETVPAIIDSRGLSLWSLCLQKL